MRGAGELFCRIRFLDANYHAAFACGGRLCLGLNCEEFAARTGGEPVIAALKGERVNNYTVAPCVGIIEGGTAASQVFVMSALALGLRSFA